MNKDLTVSLVDRQNILNNDLALDEVKNSSNIACIEFENKLYLTKNMVADFFDVELRTIERYVSKNLSELTANGYEILKGKRLKDFINTVENLDVPDINVGSISSRTSQIAVFDFRSFINIGMLLKESENARVLRKVILDIFIDFRNIKRYPINNVEIFQRIILQFIRRCGILNIVNYR